MSNRSKRNGHPVSPMAIEFNRQEKLYIETQDQIERDRDDDFTVE